MLIWTDCKNWTEVIFKIWEFDDPSWLLIYSNLQSGPTKPCKSFLVFLLFVPLKADLPNKKLLVHKWSKKRFFLWNQRWNLLEESCSCYICIYLGACNSILRCDCCWNYSETFASMLKYAVREVYFGFARRRRQSSVTPCAFLKTVPATTLWIVGVFSLSLSFAHGNPYQKDSFFSMDFSCVEMLIGPGIWSSFGKRESR